MPNDFKIIVLSDAIYKFSVIKKHKAKVYKSKKAIHNKVESFSLV